jgi:hypothetical protein
MNNERSPLSPTGGFVQRTPVDPLGVQIPPLHYYPVAESKTTLPEYCTAVNLRIAGALTMGL